jgi:hypothetical protein
MIPQIDGAEEKPQGYGKERVKEFFFILEGKKKDE